MRDGTPRRPRQLGKEVKGSGGGECGSKTGQGFVRPSVILGHDRLTRSPDGCAEMIRHGDHEVTR